MFLKGQPEDHYFVVAARFPDGRRQYKRFLASATQQAVGWVTAVASGSEADIYFKTALLKPFSERMVKENFQEQALWLWADLDAMEPATLPLKPTILVESSPGRYQALWRLAEPISMREAERYCKAISRFGDLSGWDIGQELRIPGTQNHKYEAKPVVQIVQFAGTAYTLDQIQAAISPEETPTILPSGETPEVYPFEGVVPAYALEELSVKAGDGRGRSVALWQILCQLYDDGWTAEDAFRLMWFAPANKYRIDGREPRDLWRDVVKCWDPAEAAKRGARKAPGGQGKPITIASGPSVPTRREWVKEKPHVEPGEWPLLVRRAIELYVPVTLFSEESIALLFLSGYSAGFPQLSIGGTNTALWTLLLGKQAAGKSTILNSVLRMMRAANPMLGVVTSGSPEGIMEKVSKGPTLLSFEEYSEQLKQMAKRDGYAVTNKELYQRMFDGVPIGHQTRKRALETVDTFAVMMAATNVDTWRRYGDPDDVANGYLSRFVVCADDLQERSVDRSHLRSGEDDLGALIRDRVLGAQLLARAILSNEIGAISSDGEEIALRPYYPEVPISAGELVMLEYQQSLERKWELSPDLDVTEKEFTYEIPPGRTLTKARKMAVMLELAEANPQFSGQVLVVRTENVQLAVKLATLSQAWAQRAIDWLQESAEKETVEKIIRQLENARPNFLRPWDIAVRIRGLNTAQVRALLETMAVSGMVVKQTSLGTNGQKTEVWGLPQ